MLFLWFAAENARSCIGLIRRKGDEFRNSISSVREFFCFLLLLFIILFSTPIKGVARRSNVPLQCCLVCRISVPIYFFCSLLVCHGGCNNYQVAITSPCLFDSFLDKLTELESPSLQVSISENFTCPIFGSQKSNLSFKV